LDGQTGFSDSQKDAEIQPFSKEGNLPQDYLGCNLHTLKTYENDLTPIKQVEKPPSAEINSK
jgi:hypothetical protein